MKRARTDLAAEARNEYMEKYAHENGGKIDGVEFSEKAEDGMHISEIDILNENGVRAVGRREGKYITISLPELTVADAVLFSQICKICARELRRVCDNLVKEPRSLLVCGIGNEKMTPDAIGPQTLRHILVTRQLKEREPEIFKGSGFFDICAIAPGVGADTGFDAADIIRAAAKYASPDIILAVDALAARSAERLCRTVQICTAGISPGSGVGNNVGAIDSESMGIPVVAIGVPTVIDAGTLVYDASGKSEAAEKYTGLFVCPKEIDAQAAKLSKLLGFAVNLAFHKNYPLEEMLI